MEIYNATYEDLKKDLCDLRELLVRTKNKAERRSCMSSIYALDMICNCLKENGSHYYEDTIKKNRNRLYDSIELTSKYTNTYINNFISNKDFFKYLFSRGASLYEKEIKKIEDKDIMQAIFLESDANILLHDFFKKYHPEHLNYVDELIKNNRLFRVDHLNSYSGLCFNIYKKRPLILVANEKFTIESIVSLIHELGHAIDFKDITNNFSITQSEKYYFYSSYIEFISRLYEKQALDYFYSLDINNDYVLELIDDYNYTNYCNMLISYTLSLLPDNILKKSNYLKYSQEHLKLLIPFEEYDENIEWTIDSRELDLKESTTYAISSLFSTICNYQLKIDPEKGKYLFDNIMSNRMDLFRPSIFEELNISEQDLAKYLKKELNYNKK